MSNICLWELRLTGRRETGVTSITENHKHVFLLSLRSYFGKFSENAAADGSFIHTENKQYIFQGTRLLEYLAFVHPQSHIYFFIPGFDWPVQLGH
jgi:hypothetical protein